MSKPEAEPQRRRWNWLTILPLVLFALLAALFVKQLMEGGDPSRVPSVLIGRPVPSFTLTPLAGVKGPEGPLPGLATADLKTGEVTLVNVWASWCVPCRDEHSFLMQLARDKGVRLVGINYKDDPENARRFLGTLGMPFRAIGVDQNGRTAVEWGVYGVPESFVVDGQGLIRFKQIGPIAAEADMDKVLAAIEKAKQPLP